MKLEPGEPPGVNNWNNCPQTSNQPTTRHSEKISRPDLTVRLKRNIVPNLVLKIKNKNLDLFFCLWSRQPWCLDQKDNVETDFVLLRKHSNTQIASTCSDFIPLNWTMYVYLPVKDVTKEFTQGTSTDTWTISSFGMWVDAGESDNSLIVFYSNSQFFLLPKEAVILIFKSRQFHSIMNASSLWDRLKTPGQRYTC